MVRIWRTLDDFIVLEYLHRKLCLVVIIGVVVKGNKTTSAAKRGSIDFFCSSANAAAEHQQRDFEKNLAKKRIGKGTHHIFLLALQQS
mmetsp:Transcript_40357/g.60515  ORF Transcript_40357/g.60515 Transcript_40357/m.60515 type:complete len:88 (-) Transcript_40357:493-756(-)